MFKTRVKEFFGFKPFNRDNLLKLICIVSVLCLAAVVITAVIIAIINPTLETTLTGSGLFSDFAEDLTYCLVGNPYVGDYGIHAIYPPFAFLIFYPFALICKAPMWELINGNIALADIAQSPLFVLSFVLYYLIHIAIIMLIAAKLSGFKGKKLAYLLISIFCFGPFIYAFGRGNVIMTALVFTMLFFWLYKSEKKWQREIANVCLACAIAVKIYPIILVLFFLKDRRFWDLLKTILYSLILLFIPFLLIEGGFSNISAIWNNFTHFNSGEGRNLGMSNISLDSTCAKIAYALSWVFGGANMDWLYTGLSMITRFGLLAIAIVLPLLSKNSNKVMQAMILTIGTYELFQGVSYGYTMIFMLIPIIMYLKNFSEFSKSDKIFYGVLFALIACPLLYIAKMFIIQAFALIVLVGKAIADLIKDDIRIANERKQAQSTAPTAPTTPTSDAQTPPSQLIHLNFTQ